MNEAIAMGTGILATIYIIIILFSGANALDCYFRRQLVKANFWLSASTFGFIALAILMILIDSCSNE
jgi:hypothetical protein